ncbi:MAG: AzlC family ABC transporter permease [Erysipelothrix sp.]|jgi:4-azaleucine resistance transporter AzlC|nr:AzlC family ABC transporter permease [Erysipelothrix sp.]
MNNLYKTFPSLFIISLPTLLGYLFFGMSYGFIMQSIDMSLLTTILFSALVYGGSIQYMALPWLVTPLPLFTMFLISMLVNVRHVFYSMSLHTRFNDMTWFKPWAIFTLSDETFTIWGLYPHHSSKSLVMVGTLHYFYWMGAGALGHLLASNVSFTIQGLDFVLTALFFSALLSRISDPKTRSYAIYGLVLSIICFFIFPRIIALSVSLFILVIVALTQGKKEVIHE